MNSKEGLEILPRGQKAYRPEGEPFILTCAGVNHEPIFFSNLRWISPKGEEIDDRNDAHRASFKLSKRDKDNSLLLSFLNPSEALSGTYKCVGQFQNVDQLSESIEVSFYQGITWEDCPSNQALVKGQHDPIIRCRVTAKPPPEVSWLRDFNELNPSRLVFHEKRET